MSAHAADRVAARATGIGVGFLAFMVTWLVGNRIAALLWEPPVGPIAAILVAAAAGVVVAVLASSRLGRAVSAGGRRPRARAAPPASRASH